MKNRKSLLILSLAVLFASCATTKTEEVATESKKSLEPRLIKQEQQGNVITLEEQFIKSIENIKFTVIESPTRIPMYDGKFNKPFTVQVTDNNDVPLADYQITVSVPASRNGNEVIFTEILAKTDENGKYSYTHEEPLFGSDTKISFYPTPTINNQKAVEAAKNKGVSIDWKVKSNIIYKGAILFVWEFNEKDKPINNFTPLYSKLREQGMWNVGNAPVNETSDLNKSLSKLYADNFEVVGANQFGYLIAGTVKFTQPVSECEDGYLCSLKAEISGVNMKTGEVAFTKVITNEATGANWTKCVTKCKDELATKITQEIIYEY